MNEWRHKKSESDKYTSRLKIIRKFSWKRREFNVRISFQANGISAIVFSQWVESSNIRIVDDNKCLFFFFHQAHHHSPIHSSSCIQFYIHLRDISATFCSWHRPCGSTFSMNWSIEQNDFCVATYFDFAREGRDYRLYSSWKSWTGWGLIIITQWTRRV